MQSEEKKLIENLFDRLQKTEAKYPNKNKLADELISNSLKNQPNSPYYIIQTILIQEVAIKKLNEQIIELKNKISDLESLADKKEPSFLSGLFRRSPSNIMKTEQHSGVSNHEKTITANQNPEGILNTNNTAKSNAISFIGNALQTAAGVTGGILMGNALLNLFHKNKPEEEIMNTMKDSNFTSLDGHNFNNTDQFCSQNSNDSLLHTTDYHENDSNNTINSEEVILNDDEVLLDSNINSFENSVDDDSLL